MDICEHCHATYVGRVHCVKCNRQMCTKCISSGELGPTCGLCLDREEAWSTWSESNPKVDFEEWYDTRTSS
jgi:hypothetical protein